MTRQWIWWLQEEGPGRGEVQHESGEVQVLGPITHGAGYRGSAVGLTHHIRPRFASDTITIYEIENRCWKETGQRVRVPAGGLVLHHTFLLPLNGHPPRQRI